MKRIVFAVAATLGVTAFAAPADAALFKWSVDYTGFFAEDAFISGFFIAEGTAATDGVVSGNEFDSWQWSWSGNSEVDAFTISSSDGEFASLFDNTGFFVDGTPNELGLTDGLDQGLYSSDDFGLDLEFLFVDNFGAGAISDGDLTALGTISVSDPEPVPEPATLLGLLAVAGAAAVAKRQKQAA
ncbi:PEP-CTERM sorting domain-containing protein [Leptolyngbyaceae cyanobacterium CCMR0082]|uniref:PEP-CTERM sorting domain-containing protein n=1 Tax=Adonisia turfae CCMR0082 TaxID=2304604 RepID=A0A6M0S012_9CYAN|nr:PEP-CTERM sorting domain-containing protein [Adonisia turfae]NEZ61483.1 PEP-CTERM sorting domain-containing protein [Adonisia turfae CCMR0082]